MAKAFDKILNAMPADGTPDDVPMNVAELMADGRKAVALSRGLLDYQKTLAQVRARSGPHPLSLQQELEGRARQAATGTRQLGVIALSSFERFVESGRYGRGWQQVAMSLKSTGRQDVRAALREGLDRPDVQSELAKLGVDKTLFGDVQDLIDNLPELNASSDGTSIDVHVRSEADEETTKLNLEAPRPRGRHRDAGDLMTSQALRATIVAMASDAPLPVAAVPNPEAITSLDPTKGYILSVIEGVAGAEQHARSLRDAGASAHIGQDLLVPLISLLLGITVLATIFAIVLCTQDQDSLECRIFAALALLLLAVSTVVVCLTPVLNQACGYAISITLSFSAFLLPILLSGTAGEIGDPPDV